MSRVSNRSKIEKFLKVLEFFGHKPYDMQYGDSYFIFDFFGKDGICWFKIKGCRGWRFGLWVNTATKKEKAKDRDRDYELDFFFQYERDIDKFKPSASTYAYKIYEDDCADGKKISPYMDWNRCINLIKKHRHVARYFSRNWCKYDDWVPTWRCLYENIHDDLLYEIKPAVEKWFYRITLFAYCKIRFKGCEIINNNPKGSAWHTYPEWNIKIKYNGEVGSKLWEWTRKADCYIHNIYKQ